MSRKRVLVLGGGRLNIPSIQAIRDAGFTVIVADGNPSAPGFRDADETAVADIRDAGVVRDLAERHAPIDGIVSLAEVGVRAAAGACAALRLPSISEEAARIATSKASMRRAWEAIPEHSVPFRVVLTEEEALAAVDAIGGYPVILKPDRTFGGSRGVSRANDATELATSYQFARSAGFTEEVVVEKFIESLSEHSAEVLIHGGDVSVLCIGEKVKTPPPYRVDLSVRYLAALSAHDEERVRSMCARAVAAIGLDRGAAHVEFAWTERGPVLLELGARSGGGHTPQLAHHVSGVDEIVEICRMACGLPPERFRPTLRRGGEYRFLSFPPGVFQEAIVPDEVWRHPNVCDADVVAAPGSSIGAIRTGSDRPGFVVTFGETREEAVAVADWAAQRIRVRYADGQELACAG